MPIIRACNVCGRNNRIPAKHLADSGRCGACKSELHAIDEPLDVDVEQFDEITQQSRVPVLVDFWAAWCGPCKMAAPEVAQTAREMAGKAVVLKVNTELYPQLSARFNIRGIPYFAVFASGKPVVQEAGLVNHNRMETWLKKAASPAAA